METHREITAARSDGSPAAQDVAADNQAVIDHVMTGRPLDAEILRRVRQRAEQVRQRIFREHGLVDIGVPAIRELRGPIPE